MTKDEALALALEALEEGIDDTRQCLGEILRNAGYARYDRQIAAYSEQIAKHEAAITAIKQTYLAPEGWQLVPVEPTKEMCAAAVKFANGDAVYKNVAAAALEIEEGIYGEAYSAMLAAAPNQG